MTVNGQAVKLTSLEYRVLDLSDAASRAASSRGPSSSSTSTSRTSTATSNTVEVFIGRLRKKLAVDMIKTVRGLGYRLSDDER